MTLTSTERQDACPQVAGVERHVDTGQRDGGEATLELDIALLLLKFLSLLEARVDDLAKHLLDLLDGEALGELYAGVRSQCYCPK